ncbi:carboxypeptidase regulatory-like domain-containing protein [Actinoplanes sp. NPDC023801]|uniref:carboxypeptidase regulatory-like domain-containing protein n=1 Tax=Actinoplanes sp. NPDC023801 TaxID=3154595 RepID=UPI0033EDEE35
MAALCAAALAATGLSAAGVAAAPAAAAPSATPACVLEQPDEITAFRMAEQCGRPVEIVAERTEYSRTFANQGGTATLEQNVEPQRVRQGKRWVPIDTTLKRTSAGVVPQATVLPMTFSNGGNNVVGRLVKDGREMTLTWPGKLPKPVLKGSTAIYPGVLPYVDLQVTASATGFSEVLVVKDRKAATGSKLKQLRFGLKTKGVTVRKNSSGGLRVHDAKGDEVFSAPAPLMWDSSKSIESQPARNISPEAPPAVDDTSDERTRKAVMPLKLEKDALTVTPDKALLSDPRTEYPVFIDPEVTGWLSDGAWTSVWSKYPSKSFWKNTTALTDGEITGTAGVGRTEDCSGCADHIVRSFFRLNTSAVTGPVSKAEFYIQQRWSWTCSPKTSARVWETGGISSATTWNNQPKFSGLYATQVADRKYGAVHGCRGVGDVEFDVTKMVTDAETTVTLGMKAIDESTKNQWKRYRHSTARLSVTFNRKPNALKNQVTDGNKACVTGAGRPYVAKRTGITATGYQSDPDNNTMNTYFYWWPVPGGAPNTNNAVSQANGSNGNVTGTFPTLNDETTYAWRALTEDRVAANVQGKTWSEKTCEFTIDATPPPAPGGLSSTDYSTTVPSGGVGYPGTFKIAAPVLTGMSEADALKRKQDIASYAWTLDGGVSQAAQTVPVNTTDFTGSITLTPMTDGQKVLRVWAKDKAGNLSGQVTYTFTVLHGSGPAAAWNFDEATTTSTPDTTGHGNALSLTGTSLVAGRGAEGKALTFDGHSGKTATTPGPVTYVNTGTGSTVAVRTDASFTVTARVRPVTTTGTGQNIAVAANGSRTSAFTLGSAQTDGKFRFTMANTDADNAAVYSAVSNVAATADKWTHLTGVYDASTKRLTLYVNGVAQTTTATLPAGFNATGPITVGKAKWNGADGGYYNGLVDDVQIYNSVAKTESIVQQAMPLQPVISFPNGSEIDPNGTLRVTFDAKGDTNVTRYRYSLDADNLGSSITLGTAGGAASVNVSVGATVGDRLLFAASEDALRRGPTTQLGFTVIAPAGSLSGPVTDEGGMPLTGAKVSLKPGDRSTTSDGNGIYGFEQLPYDSYVARAEYQGRCGFAGSSPVTVGKNPVTLALRVFSKGSAAGHLCQERTTTYATGTTVLPLTGDDAATKITLPFAFPFFGTAYPSVCVDTNGLVFFEGECVSHPYTGSGGLGDVVDPNGVIAPYWDDLVVDSSANVRTAVTGTGAGRQVLIEWNNVHRKGNTAQRVSFSVTLGADGTVTTNYAGLDNAAEQGANAIVGIEDPTGEDGFAYSEKEAVLGDNKAVVFTNPNAGVLPMHNLTGRLTNAAGAAVAGATVSIDPSGLTATTAADGTYAFPGLVDDSYTVSTKQDGRCGTKVETVVDLTADTVRDLRLGADYGLMGYACSTGASGYVPANTVLPLTGQRETLDITLPFEMKFYGVDDATVRVHTDGWIGVGGGYLDVFENDFIIDGSASVRTEAMGTAPNRSFAIEWRNALFAGTTERSTFEVILHEDGRAVYHYGAMATDLQKGSKARLGMETDNPAVSQLHSMAEGLLTPNSSMTYTPAPNGVINGVLTEAVTTNPVASTPVTLEPLGLTVNTGADGSFQFGNIPPGQYELRADPDTDRCLGQYAMATVRKGGTDLKVDLSLNYDADPHYNCSTGNQEFITAGTVQDWTGDDAAWQTTAPFPIKLYGETTTRPWISSNGFVTFSPEGATSSLPGPIPSEGDKAAPHAAAYAFWEDWVVDGDGAIATQTVGTAPNRQWIVEWRNVHKYNNDSARATFEIIFSENGSIEYRYTDLADNPNSRGAGGVVGIEGPGGVIGFEYLDRRETLEDGLSITFAAKAPATGSITGTVTCADQPVAGATVTAVGRSATTGANGAYVLADVPSKAHTVLVTVASGDCAGTATKPAVVGAGGEPVDFDLSILRAADRYTITETPHTYAPLSSGTTVAAGYDTWTDVTLAFPVTLYGASYTTMSVGSAGALGLGDGGLYPFAGNWEADSTSSVRTAVRGTAPNRQFVVEWRDMRHHEDAGTRVSFQAIIDEAGGFTYAYANPGAGFAHSGGAAWIGLDAWGGASELEYSDRLTVLRPGYALRIQPVPAA